MEKQDISVNSIKNTYKKVYNFFFKYFIYIIIWILWIITIINIFSHKNIALEKSEDFIIERARLLWEFNKKTSRQIGDKKIQIHILNWNIKSDRGLLVSNNNLISYDWIILPKNTFIYQTQLLKGAEYFKNTDYDISELENIAKNTIFINLDQIENTTNQYAPLPLKENIENTFYIKCIKQKKLSNLVCNNYINKFLNDFYIYNIDKDYEWLKEVFEILYNTKHKKAFCDWMIKYIIYSNNTSGVLEPIFTKCWEEYIQDFQNFKNFLEIQEQLEKWYITPTLYDNTNLNEYKLISFQQTIYNDLQQNIINSIRIKSYFNYLNNILKNKDSIDTFYIDLSYWFNNNYILNTLNKNKYKFSENKKAEIESIVKNINLINNWDILEWHNWLKKILVNKNLENIQNKETTGHQEQSKLELTLKSIKSLSFLRVISEKFDDEKIKINWYFSIKAKDDNLPIYLWFSTDKNWVLESISINEYKDLNETIKNIIKQKKSTIAEVYQYIQDNINLFISSDNLSTCDLIKGKLKSYQNANKQINRLSVTYCDKNNINIFKEEKEQKQTNKLFYKIILDNFNIKDIEISEPKLEIEIKEYLKDIETNNITIPTIVQEIITYKSNNLNLKQEWTNNIIIAIEDFQNYLQIIPIDISDKNWRIAIEFSIKNIKFTGTYDINNKILYNLSFKYKENENGISKQDLSISNFNLSLTDDNKNEINKFVLSPLNYISNIDKNSVESYQKLH